MAIHPLLEQIARDPQLPTPPAVALHVIQRASRPDCSLVEIATLISGDPALCAKVLKLVNSAFFSLPRAITSVRHALNLLGLLRVRSLVLSLSLPAMQPRSANRPWVRQYWKASVASAIAAHSWAAFTHAPDPDNELVASLLCDLGTLVFMEMFPDKYEQVAALPVETFVRNQCDVERELFGVDHAEVSAHLLETWGFPEDITVAIRHHHRPDDLSEHGPALHNRAWLLAFAGKIGQLQIAPDQPALFVELMDLARDRFRLNQEQFITFLEPLEQKVKGLASLLQIEIGPCYHYPTLLANAAEQLARLASETALDNIRVHEEKSQAESDLRRGEEALEQLGRKHEIILNAAGEGIYGLDLDGKITFVNAAAARLIGWVPDELIGKSQHDVLQRPAPKKTMLQFPGVGTGTARKEVRWEESPIRAVLLDAQTRIIDDDVFWRKDQTSFPVTYTCAPIFEHQQIAGAVVTFRDMTQHRRLEAQLRQSQKMEAVGRLAGGVAHDFNNLLTVVLGCGEMLLRRCQLDQAATRLINEITKAGEQAAALTRQLLAFSRLQVLEPKLLSLNTVVRDVEKLLRRLIGEDITLTTVFGPDLWTVRADPGQIEQVILNLAVNARDAMPRGGSLTIETKNVELDEMFAQTHQDVPSGRYVLLGVSDTGCGMDEATKARIFEPFFTTKEPGKGTGLGLATVYGIVQQSGGNIYAYSELGSGTSFKVYLPRVEGKSLSSLSLPSAAQPAAPGGTETLLVVEDEEPVRRLIRQVLQERGYNVLVGGNGTEVLAVCDSHPELIHLILTDVVMPKMSGSELVRQITQLRPGIKVLFMSGYTDDAVVRHGVLSTGTPFLQKPFTPIGLARKVREVLDQKAVPAPK